MADKDKITVGVSILGAVITVIGLVFLAVQAFSRGWLGPATAVTGAAVICLALIALAFIVHRRSPRGPSAPALLSVGVLGLFTDLWVLVFGLEWLAPTAGIVLVAALAVAGLFTAWAWGRQPLAVILVAAGTVFLTPAIIYLLDVTATTRFDALALIVLGLLGATTTWHRPWPAASGTSAAVYVLGLLVLDVGGQPTARAVSGLVGGRGVAWLSLSPPLQPTALSVFSRWIPVSLLPVMLLVSSSGDDDSDLGVTGGVVACLVIAGATTAFAVVGAAVTGAALRPVDGDQNPPTVAGGLRCALCCGVAGLVIVVATRQMDIYSVEAMVWMIVLLAIATTLIVLADRLPVTLVWTVFILTLAYCLPRVAPAWFDTPASPILTWPVLVLLAVPGALILRSAGVLGATKEIIVGLAAVLLIVVSSAIPLIFMTFSTGDLAFMAGHLVMSVTWMSLGVMMLARDNGAVGLALALLATAKLVFYDLSALAGLIQVAAFIICGAILLVTAVLRERHRTDTADTPAGV
ncbi:MAG: hypothetical protein ACTHVU_06385 [Corynebacterium sp.]|uniref:hypothetical protein n=1 Tax=Corynebacterium sp. TaxID=1720 RepID=UPI003F8E586A